MALPINLDGGGRTGKVMEEGPGDELGRRPGVGVGPVEELVGHPGEHAERRVVEGEG